MAEIAKTTRIAALCIVAPLCSAFPAHAAEGETRNASINITMSGPAVGYGFRF
ncbi:MAG TPA: hypothetical protein VJ484_07620 [Lysobacter sp.]|nr:hypothetical protein [Lysobacter sp.]